MNKLALNSRKVKASSCVQRPKRSAYTLTIWKSQLWKVEMTHLHNWFWTALVPRLQASGQAAGGVLRFIR